MIKKYLMSAALLFSISLCAHIGLVRLGTQYGAWTIPSELLHKNAVCYCAGAGEDISFDMELIKNYDCTVHTFDPTPRALAHVEYIFKQTFQGLKATINNSRSAFYSVLPQHLSNFEFHPLGLWKENAEVKFYAPQSSAHVSHSILNLQKTERYFIGSCKRLSSIMKELGHTQLALLKIDIEGAEYAVLDSIIEDNLDIKCICVEFDEFAGINYEQNNDKEGAQRRVQERISALEHMGYIIVYAQGYTDMTFLRKDIALQLDRP